MSAPTHAVTLPMDGCECFRCQQLRAAQLTPAKAFEAEAVKAAQSTLKRYQQRLADEQAMADTVATGSDDEIMMLRSQLKALIVLNGTVQRDNITLTARIEELEAARQKRGDTSALLDQLARIAYVLRTFYFAELSLSSVQPLLALCLELNPEIVEQKR
jgi:hypothetical protein